MKSKTSKRASAFLLGIVMMIGLMPVSVFGNNDRLTYDVAYSEDFTEAKVEIHVASGEEETLTKLEVNGEDVTKQVDDGTLILTTDENCKYEVKAAFTKEAEEENDELTVVVDRIQAVEETSNPVGAEKETSSGEETLVKSDDNALPQEDGKKIKAGSAGSLRTGATPNDKAGDAATTVTTYDEFVAALADKAETIELGANITVTGTLSVDYSVTINGNGYTLTRSEELLEEVIEQKAGTNTLTLDSVVIDGADVEARHPAVFIESGNTLIATGCTVKNCTNTSTVESAGIASEDHTTITLDGCTIKDCVTECGDGGGLSVNQSFGRYSENFFLENIVTIRNCVFQGNKAFDCNGYGGGIFIGGAEKVTIENSVIDSNEADFGGGAYFQYCGVTAETDEEAAEAAETGVTITDTVFSNNTANEYGGGFMMGYSVVRIHGHSKLYGNVGLYDGGAICGQEYYRGDNRGYTWLFLHDNTELYENRTEDDGGAIEAGWINLIMSDNVCIHDNEALSAGGVLVGNGWGYPSVFKMNDNATIRDNKSEWGGGLLINDDHEDSVRHLIAKNIYDNSATGEWAEGDDIFFNYRSSQEADYFLFRTHEARPYGDGNSKELGTVTIESVEGYDNEPTMEDGVMVPWLGWFEDVEDNRYKNPRESTLITDTFDHELGTSTDVSFKGYKAIWYGLAVVYDSNYTNETGGTDYQYDKQAYALNADATVLDNMFDRPGYRFIGWNTAADGSGEVYAAEDTMTLQKSTVLYAQWERKTGNLTVSKTVSGNAADKTKAFTFTITLSDKAISGEFGDMTFENGVATFKLRDGEKKTAEGLPDGASYTVVESDNEGYEVTKTGDTGTIVCDTTAIAAFTNMKNSTKPANPDDTPSDKPEEPDSPSAPSDSPSDSGTPDKSTEPSAPQTGDDSNIALWMISLLASVAGMSVCISGMKRRKNKTAQMK